MANMFDIIPIQPMTNWHTPSHQNWTFSISSSWDIGKVLVIQDHCIALSGYVDVNGCEWLFDVFVGIEKAGVIRALRLFNALVML